MTGVARASQAASALVVLGVAAACSSTKAGPQRAAVPVSVAVVRRAAVPYMLIANGLVAPLQTAAVTPQVDGLITQVAFHEGQDVARGAVLFQIEPRPYQAAYEQALAALARDRATAENARREAERYDQLVQQDYVTREQADQQRATAAAAEATVAADEAAVATAKFNFDNTTIRAPIAGRTGGLLVRAGNVVRAVGSTPLVVINQIRPILVRFAVPGSELPLIQQYGARGGLPVTALLGPLPTPMVLDTAGGVDSAASTAPSSDTPRAPAAATGVAGTLSFIDNAVDTTTGTVMLKATFANAEGTLWVGQFVPVTLRLFVEQRALVVPAQAVLTGQQGAYVYVVDSAGTVQQRRVAVERTADTLTVIASGLREGELTVTEGQSRLTPGAKVMTRTVSDSAAPSAPRRGARGSGA